MIVRVDWENNAERWWGAALLAVRAGNRPPQWHVFEPLFNYASEVSCLQEEANAFFAWAEQIDGYKEGPSFARTPFGLYEDEDE
jgi:hypothetical protein